MAGRLKADVMIKGSIFAPFEHDAIITLEGKELAVAVGEYVEREYGVEALSARIDMKRKQFGSSLAHTTVSVRVRKKSDVG